MSRAKRKFEKERKRRRDKECKRLRKIRQARDLASPHVDFKILTSDLVEALKFNRLEECTFTSTLAHCIIDGNVRVMGHRMKRPPKPPAQKFKQMKQTSERKLNK